MTRRLLLLAILLLSTLPDFAAANRDPLAPVLDLPHPPVAAVPGDLFLPEQMQGMTGNVNEAREFGVPLAVRVIAVPTSPAVLDDALPFGGAAPSGQEIVQRMADDWLAEESLETSPDAADGILLFVVVPEDDHSQAMAAFATGKNALPLNGLTRQSLDDVLDGVIRPAFRNGTIADGIRTGIAMLSYDNLFAQPARLERTPQQETLFTVTNTVFFGLAVVSSLALVGLAWWIRFRHRTINSGGTILSPFEAGALLRGRVDDAVVTGALLHLVRMSALTTEGDRLRIASDVAVEDPFANDIRTLLIDESAGDGVLSAAALRRIQDALVPAKQSMESTLARRGLVKRSARVESAWLVLASGFVAAIALLGLVPAIVSMSRVGIAGILIAMLTITGVLIWTAKRSWITPAGRHALREWQARPHSDGDLRIVDTITHQDTLIDTPGGPGVPPITHLVREFRALGAG